VTDAGGAATPAAATPAAGIGIVVPTLGRRVPALGRALASLTAQRTTLPGDCPLTVVVVVPPQPEARAVATAAGAAILDDPGSFAGAINAGIAWLRQHTTPEPAYVGWLNDDDELLPGALSRVAARLDADARAVAAFGQCWYVGADDRPLWLSAYGRWAPSILGWGPDLVPQPGLLIRAAQWQRIGGLADDLHFAIDLDLLLRLRRRGGLAYEPTPVARFRWQEGTKSVSERHDALQEATRVKRAHAGAVGRLVLTATEPVVRWASHRAAGRLTGTRGTPLPAGSSR